jgi:hypothetical protein
MDLGGLRIMAFEGFFEWVPIRLVGEKNNHRARPRL